MEDCVKNVNFESGVKYISPNENSTNVSLQGCNIHTKTPHSTIRCDNMKQNIDSSSFNISVCHNIDDNLTWLKKGTASENMDQLGKAQLMISKEDHNLLNYACVSYLNTNILKSRHPPQKSLSTNLTVVSEPNSSLVFQNGLNIESVHDDSCDMDLEDPDQNSKSINEINIIRNTPIVIATAVPSSTAVDHGNVKHSLFDHRDLDSGDHEFFCDLCEEFHPWKRDVGTESCKEKRDSSFLRCVFEKRDLSILNTQLTETSSQYNINTKPDDTTTIDPNKSKNVSEIFTKGKRYLVQFKSKVVTYALKTSAKQAAATFSVNRGTVSQWLNERNRSSNCVALKSQFIQVILQIY